MDIFCFSDMVVVQPLSLSVAKQHLCVEIAFRHDILRRRERRTQLDLISSQDRISWQTAGWTYSTTSGKFSRQQQHTWKLGQSFKKNEMSKDPRSYHLRFKDAQNPDQCLVQVCRIKSRHSRPPLQSNPEANSPIPPRGLGSSLEPGSVGSYGPQTPRRHSSPGARHTSHVALIYSAATQPHKYVLA